MKFFWQIYKNKLIYIYPLVVILFLSLGLIISYLLFNNNDIIDSFNGFDVAYYLRISKFGYLTENQPNFEPKVYAFFPTTSFLYRIFLGFIFPSFSIIFYSIVMPSVLSLMVYRYILNERLSKINLNSFLASLFYFFIPFGFFFVVPYSELSFAVTFIALYIFLKSNKSRYIMLILCAILFSLSRPNSIVLAPALIIYGIISFNVNSKLFKKIVVVLLTQFFSFLTLFTHHYYKTGDFFAARNAQSLWGRSSKTTFNFSNLYSRTVNNIKLSSVECTSGNIGCYLKGYLPLYGFIFWVSISIIALIKMKKTKENIFLQLINLFLIILPISSGSIGSFNRYLLLSPLILIVFPLWLRSLFEKNKYYIFIITPMILINLLFLVLYFNNFWLG